MRQITVADLFCGAQGLVLQANQGAGRVRNIRAVESPMQSDSLAVAFVLAQGSGGAPRDAREPAPTIPTRGAHSLVVPYHRSGRAKALAEPFPTQTTRDRFGPVTPVTHRGGAHRARSLDSPLPVTGAELAFIAAAFGERRGQLPRTHSIEQPVPAICAKGRINVIRGFVEDRGIDIHYRMCQPSELAAAMGFPPGYRWSGTKTEVTAQIGNAVPVGLSRAVTDALLESIL